MQAAAIGKNRAVTGLSGESESFQRVTERIKGLLPKRKPFY